MKSYKSHYINDIKWSSLLVSCSLSFKPIQRSRSPPRRQCRSPRRPNYWWHSGWCERLRCQFCRVGRLLLMEKKRQNLAIPKLEALRFCESLAELRVGNMMTYLENIFDGPSVFKQYPWIFKNLEIQMNWNDLFLQINLKQKRKLTGIWRIEGSSRMFPWHHVGIIRDVFDVLWLKMGYSPFLWPSNRETRGKWCLYDMCIYIYTYYFYYYCYY